MCEYCKLNRGNPREELNDNPVIGEFQDGHQTIELTFNRYVVDADDIRNETRIGELVIMQSLAPNFGGGIIQTKSIPINYCPFCGEEL